MFTVFSRISSSLHPFLFLTAIFAADELKFLEQNGVSFPELQFTYGTRDVTGCLQAEGLVAFHLVSLAILTFFS